MYMLRSHRITEWMSNVAILEISFKTGDFSNPSELKPSSDYFWISSRICVFRLKLWKHRSPQVFKVCCYFFNQNELDIIYFENQKFFTPLKSFLPPFLKLFFLILIKSCQEILKKMCISFLQNIFWLMRLTITLFYWRKHMD